MKKLKVAKNKTVKITKDGKQLFSKKATKAMIVEAPESVIVR